MEIVMYFFIFLFGLSFGSFLNAWIYRVRENMKICSDRSICPTCHQHLVWYDNIPLISYLLFLKGKCRRCKIDIHWQYPVVEFSVGILFVFVAYLHNFHLNFILTPELLRDFIIVFLLTFIFIYDLKYKEILDRVTLLPALFLFFATGATGWFGWYDMCLGILIGGGFFLLQYIISKGKWIGGGDIRLGVFMGVILGWQNTVLALLIAYVVGALVGVYLLINKKKGLKSELPFGTFLVISTFVAMFWGSHIIEWYLGLLG